MSVSELERLAAACLLPSFEGPEAPDWIRRGLADGFGGVVLFASNIVDRSQLAALTAALRAEAGGILIGLDEEGGDVTRLETANGSSYPGNLALGLVDDVGLTERVAASIGAELAAVGVNLDFAPVADVNVNAENPVIGVRSFGDDPVLVARHVAAFVTGLQSTGVAACAKHFPGHGATAVDSHLELPTVEGAIDDALVPFHAAIEAGTRTIMTAHIRAAALDDAPATISPVVLGLLRDKLGFDGVVVTDALEMRAISDTVGVEDGAVRAIAAGADTLIVGRDLGEAAVERMHRALVDAVASGRLGEGRLREAAARVRRAGAAAVPRAGATDREAGALAARRALHVEGDVAIGRDAVVVELRPAANIAAGTARHTLGGVLRSRSAGIDARVGDSVPAGADLVVVRDAHRHPWMREAVDAAGAVVVVEIGLPVSRPARARGYLATGGGSRASFEAAADELLAAVAAR